MKKTIQFFLSLFCLTGSLNAAGTADDLKWWVYYEIPYVQGWCSAEKALSFIDLILEVKPEVCVEIGVFGGSSILPTAAALKFLGKGTVYAIDPWDRIEAIKHFDPILEAEHLAWWSKVNLNAMYDSFLNMLDKYELNDFCHTIRLSSEAAAPQIGQIDILHLDGNHSEMITTQDVLLYLPKVRSGGYIWINDSLHPNIQQANELLLESCDVIKLVNSGNCILFKKR